MIHSDSHDTNAEASRILALAEAQMKSSLQEGHEGIQHLSHCFNTLTQNHPELFQPLTEAIVALQFYDRLSQRMEHAISTIEQLGSLMNENHKIEPDQWQSLQASVRQAYTMETERQMFDHILQGNTVNETLKKYQHNLTNQDGDSENTEVSLF